MEKGCKLYEVLLFSALPIPNQYSRDSMFCTTLLQLL